MSLADLRINFLVIGTPSRKREVDAALAGGALASPYLGEKGIGRLSAMRLGERLRVETARAIDKSLNLLEIDWRDFADIDAMLGEVHVAPETGGDKPTNDWSGTSIVMSDLLDNWTPSRVRAMCDYEFARLTDPFVDPAKRPRIALFWNGIAKPFPCAVQPSRRGTRTRNRQIRDGGRSSIAHDDRGRRRSGFEHPFETETVSLALEDLQGALVGRDGELEDQALASVGPFTFEAHWFNRRRLSRVDATGEKRAIRELQEQWSGILLFRDRFRVFPYGEDEDDWLELDRRALRRSGYTLNKTQFVGRVNISRAGNPALVDQTNREGLRVTPEQRVLLQVIRYAIQDRLGEFMRGVERQYKGQKMDLSHTKSQVNDLETRVKTAIRQLRKLTPPEGTESINQLQQTFAEFSDFAAGRGQDL